MLKSRSRTKDFNRPCTLKICSNIRVKHASFLTPWPVPTLCLESLSEMEKLYYLFTLHPLGKIWQSVCGGKITCHWNLPQGHKID